MKLLRNWRRILRDAWSSRLIIIAAVLSGIEVILPLFSEKMSVGVFAGASFAVTCSALVARITAQPTLHEEDPEA